MLKSILGLCLICHYFCPLNFHYEKNKSLHDAVMVMNSDIYIYIYMSALLWNMRAFLGQQP